MKILVLSAVGLVAINIGDFLCALKRINLLVLHVSHVILARGKQGNNYFDNLSVFWPCFFHENFAILTGFSAFPMRVASIMIANHTI